MLDKVLVDRPDTQRERNAVEREPDPNPANVPKVVSVSLHHTHR